TRRRRRPNRRMADWRHATLSALGAPASADNLTGLQAWALSEGMAVWANNPLAATDRLPGSQPYPPAPAVQIYPGIDDVAQLYASKFRSSIYRAIGDALVGNAGLSALWRAVNRSP